MEVDTKQYRVMERLAQDNIKESIVVAVLCTIFAMAITATVAYMFWGYS